MNLDIAGRELAYLDIEADLDLDDVTLEVAVGRGADFETWEWAGDTTTTGTGAGQRWQRTGSRLLAGPEAGSGQALVLPTGRHPVRWRPGGTGESAVRRAEDVVVG